MTQSVYRLATRTPSSSQTPDGHTNGSTAITANCVGGADTK